MTSRPIAFNDLEFGTTIQQVNPPAEYGNPGGINTAFTGDLSNTSYVVGKTTSGAATLTQPSSGYFIYPENSIVFNYLSNDSGYNSSTSGNGGRTGIACNYTKVDNYGQGDAIGFFVNAFVDGAKPGATNFLANPACGLFGGQIFAGQSGVYLNPYEVSLNDEGYDVAAIGYVVNISRSNNTGALGVIHFGFRSQSKGTAPIDVAYSASGNTAIGIDLSGITTNSSGSYTNAGIVLLGGDRIYLNGTAPSSQPGYAASTGTTYLLYANSGIQGVSNNSPAFLFDSSSAFLYAPTITLNQSSNNKILVTGASTGSAPGIFVSATSDTNQDLKLGALGTGVIEFTSTGSFSANGSVATSLGSVGPTGSHTTVQEWFTVKDSGGNVRYIPCF